MNPIDGKWQVEVESGPWWFHLLKGNKKVIEDNNGYNVMAGIKWGKFTVSESRYKITLTYTDLPIIDNIQFIVDELVHEEKSEGTIIQHVIYNENELFGSFYWNGHFKGTFTMTRVTPSSDQ